MADELESIYDSLVAERKLKHGTKLEHLAALFFKHLNPDTKVIHDVRLRGEGKKTKHQIDVTLRGSGEDLRLIIECRHLLSTSKRNLIRLSAVRDFASVVRDLEPDRSMMLTTVGYTRPAQTYADEQQIELVTLRAFAEEDWRGRVQRIVLRFRLLVPSPMTITDFLLVDDNDRAHMNRADGGSDWKQTVQTAETYFRDASGRQTESFFDVLAPIIQALPLVEGDNSGVQEFDQIRHVLVNDVLVAIRGFAWSMSLGAIERESVIEADEDDLPRLLLQSVNLSLDEVITEKQIRTWQIGDNGEVVPRQG